MPIAAAAVALGLVLLAHIAPFPFLLDAFAGERTVWRMPHPPGDRGIYLTFDDGPNPTATPELLDLLRDRQVAATFFLIPEHVTPETAPLVRRMFDEGHTVAQHTGTRWLLLRSPASLAAHLQSTADHIESLAGHRPAKLFRPHAGWRSVTMLAGLRKAGYKMAGWSWLSFDFVWFRQRTGDRVADQILAHAAPGKIIVIHDGHHRDPRPDRRYAIEAAALLIEGLRARGYEFRTLESRTP